MITVIAAVTMTIVLGITAALEIQAERRHKQLSSQFRNKFYRLSD